MTIAHTPDFRDQYAGGIKKDAVLEAALSGNLEVKVAPQPRPLDAREALRRAITGNPNPNLKGWG